MFGKRGGNAARVHAGADPINVVIDNRTVSVCLRADACARRFILRLKPDGTPVLTVPMGARRAEAARVLDRHTGWLASRLAKHPERVPFADGQCVPVRGDPHRIEHRGLRGRPVTVLCEDGERILDVRAPSDDIARRVTSFLQTEARLDLDRAVTEAASRSGTRFNKLRLGDQKSRWGSCSSNGTLSFSWRLILAPPHVLQYLAAHEVAHLTEMNHGPDFWKLCERLADDMPGAQAWLGTHGRSLHAFG